MGEPSNNELIEPLRGASKTPSTSFTEFSDETTLT